MTDADPHEPRSGRIPRRQFLKGVAAASLALGSGSSGQAAPSSTLRIATYGGNFENTFVKYIYPEFQKRTGIAVQSVSEPGGLEFLLQIAQSNRAGSAPIDLCLSSQTALRRGAAENLWRSFDANQLPQLSNLKDSFIYRSGGAIQGIAAMGWYQSLVVDTEALHTLPTSWSVLWDLGKPNAWGVTGGGDGDLLEIAAALYFGGNRALATEAGILKVIGKIAELKPAVKLWWKDEGTMQTALENQEVLGGMYFHDVAGVMRRSGVPVTSIFPKEGAVLDYGSWVQPAGSQKVDETAAFLDFMCQPSTQSLLSRRLGTAPIVDRKLLDLTDAEFAAVSSEAAPIEIAVEARMQHQDFMDAQFTKMLTG